MVVFMKSSGFEQDLARAFRAVHPALSVAGFGQRKYRVDSLLKSPLPVQLQKSLEFLVRIAVGSDDLNAHAVHPTEFERDLGAGGGTADDQPSARPQRGQGCVPESGTDVIEHHVDAAAARDLVRPLRNVGVVVAEHMLRAETPRVLELG